ncbi:hypothetical protein H17ap60334_07428 [Thermosipho africanus H17ap60334]|uniref:hypothetical protein n=1 Tax=Thermosipho africanus TaxID=2421 RepID=UPI00028DF017|nr:hypothetical protein [Thermosipho africanus]EKF49130.1 hypothetical protein H17ap60334_07428 [Thermosipho africanus H17ap60334]MDK2886948.1 hypothetical protein [Thermosipho sp. (in: thermotogales)]
MENNVIRTPLLENQLFNFPEEKSKTSEARKGIKIASRSLPFYDSSTYMQSFQRQIWPSSTKSTLTDKIYSFISNVIQMGVHVEEDKKVSNYLLNFPDMQWVINIAIEVVKRYLPGVKLFLDLYQDPEIEDKFLVLYVRTTNYNRDFIEKLRKAEEEVIKLLVDKQGWIQITSDFREVR